MAKKRPPQRKSSSKASSSKSSSKGRFSGTSAKKSQRSKAGSSASNPLLGDFIEQQIYPRAGLVAMCLVGLLFLIVFGDYFFGKYLYLFKDMGSDSLNIYYPVRAHFADLLREEGLVGWSFKQGMGQSISGMGLGNPFNLLFSMAGAENVPYMVIYCVLIEILVSGWFFSRYLKLLGYSPFTVILGTVLFAFSGFVFGTTGFWNFWKQIIGAVLLLYSSELLIQKDNWWPFPIAVYFVAGPRLILFVIFLTAYAIFRYLNLKGVDIKGLLILGGKMVVLGLIGVLISAAFTFPVTVNLLNSPRIAGNASSFSSLLTKPLLGLPSEDHEIGVSILRLFSSEMFGSMRDYKGFWNYMEAPFYSISTLGLLLIPLVFLGLDKRKKIIFTGFTVFWLIPMVFPFFRHAFFLYAAPHYRLFSLLITIVLLFFALSALNNIDKKQIIHLPLLLGTFLVLLLLLNFPYFDQQTLQSGKVNLDTSVKSIVNVFLILNTGLLLFLRIPKYKYVVQALIILSVMGEYGFTYHKSAQERDMVTSKEWKSRTGYNDYTKEAIAHIKNIEKTPFYRVHQYYNSSPAMHSSLNDAFVFNYYSTPSYQSSNQPNYLEFLKKVKIARENNITDAKWAPGLRGRYALEVMASVKYNLTKKGEAFRQPQGLVTKIAEFENVEVNKMNLNLPFGFTYDKYMTYQKFVKMGQRKIDKTLLKAVVIFEEDQNKVKNLTQILPKQVDGANPSFTSLQTDVNALKEDSLIITTFTQDYIKGNIQLDKEKVLFFSFPFDKGWHAMVDGKPADLLKVNVGLTGLVLSPGNHEIVLTFKMPYMNLAKILTLIGLLLLVGVIVWEKKWKKKTSQTDLE